MKPTVARMVHYTNPEQGNAVQAAVVTEVLEDGSLVLAVYGKEGQFEARGVAEAAKAGEPDAGGCWAWPAKASA